MPKENVCNNEGRIFACVFVCLRHNLILNLHQPEHEMQPSLLIMQTGTVSIGCLTRFPELILLVFVEMEAMLKFSSSSAAAIASASTVNLIASTAGRVRK